MLITLLKTSSIIQRFRKPLFWLFCLSCAVYVFASAWVAEDAYITFRVIDNLLHGYGLRWNIDDRVQVYTHPLWMLLHIPFYAVFGHIFLVTIALSAVCGLMAVACMATSVEASYLQLSVLLLLPLACSKIFNDFVICGLENPLTFLTLAWVWRLWLKPQTPTPRLLLAAGLCFLVRFDNSLLIAPMVAMRLWQHRRTLPVKRCLLAASPVLAWLAFSVFYYGFALPNTKYAKLGANFPFGEILRTGTNYYLNLVYDDPFAVAYALLLIVLMLPHQRFRPVLAPLAGVTMYLAYILYIGGDYLTGRFFAAPFVSLVMAGYVALRPAFDRQKRLLWLAMVLLALGSMPYVWHPKFAATTNWDERKLFGNHLFHEGHIATDAYQEPARVGREMASRPDSGHPQVITNQAFQGMFGYYAGPRYLIIDMVAIADPLLSRLPANHKTIQMSGHYFRDIPPGYQHFRETGDMSGLPPLLIPYYEKLHLVTSGPLWSMERLETILGFQFGLYDGLLEQYIQTLPK